MIPERIYPAGTIPAYSNYGLTLAGYIVSRVSGESIVQYVERHILEHQLVSTRVGKRDVVEANAFLQSRGGW